MDCQKRGNDMLRERFALLFDGQIRKLEKLGFNPMITDAFIAEKENVLNKAMKVLVNKEALSGEVAGDYPFVPVISYDFCSVFDFASRIDCRVGFNPLHPIAISEIVPFGGLYYIFSVSTKRIHDILSPLTMHALAKKSSQKCLNIFELLSFCLQTGIHREDAVCASDYIFDSLDMNNCKVPVICKENREIWIQFEGAINPLKRRSPMRNQGVYIIEV